MINAVKAYNIMREAYPDDKIENMAETSDCFIFGVTSKTPERIGRCGYDIVDKTSGKIGFMHIVDYAKIVDSNSLKEIKLPIK